jgi:hypothetical protein
MQKYVNGALVVMTPAEVTAFQDGQKVDPAKALADWRATASMSRLQFCWALAAAGILPKPEALASAKGEWPATFSAALSGMTADQEFGAQLEWATATTIRRNHQMIAMLTKPANLTPEQVDALFGWVVA